MLSFLLLHQHLSAGFWQRTSPTVHCSVVVVPLSALYTLPRLLFIEAFALESLNHFLYFCHSTTLLWSHTTDTHRPTIYISNCLQLRLVKLIKLVCWFLTVVWKHSWLIFFYSCMICLWMNFPTKNVEQAALSGNFSGFGYVWLWFNLVDAQLLINKWY